MLVVVAIAVVFVLVGVTAWLTVRLRRALAAARLAEAERDRIVQRFQGVLSAETERERILADASFERDRLDNEVARLRLQSEQALAEIARQRAASAAEASQLEARVAVIREELRALDEEANLESFGFYKPHYSFSESERYEQELERIREQQKQLLKDKAAAVCPVEWSVGGSRAEGKKATNQTLKLMLRAFNGECDAAVAKVKYNNVRVMEARIGKSFDIINGLAEVNQCRIVAAYRDLKLAELRLVHEYEEKLQAEKEEQRRIREQIRDEEIAQRQLEKAREDAEREEAKYQEALDSARQEVALLEGAKQAKLSLRIEELERRLAEAHTNKERAIAQAQLTKSGHVYVVSNVGSFGEHVFKIGMTRRLDPLERIKELSDASVPFNFDVHAVIFSENAPALEAELHRQFELRRVNRVNERKEFFRVTIHEIAAAVHEKKSDVQFLTHAAAEEYRKTQALVEAEVGAAPRLVVRRSSSGDERDVDTHSTPVVERTGDGAAPAWVSR